MHTAMHVYLRAFARVDPRRVENYVVFQCNNQQPQRQRERCNLGRRRNEPVAQPQQFGANYLNAGLCGRNLLVGQRHFFGHPRVHAVDRPHVRPGSDAASSSGQHIGPGDHTAGARPTLQCGQVDRQLFGQLAHYRCRQRPACPSTGFDRGVGTVADQRGDRSFTVRLRNCRGPGVDPN
ncbi:Uncharacterised protein [Mycobacterium tuberculosis]|nr:Uncharacterised protein [Mycobacterium tuberculosis]